MFGSRHEPKLMDGRKIIWSVSSSGIELSEVISQLNKLTGEAMMFGYWEYGDEIVVTVPVSK